MAQDVPGSDFEFWLNKAVEWGQATSLESQQDVCLHLPKLQEFLLQVHETLKHVNFAAAIGQFPLIGQLLGRLCWNPFVVASNESHRTLIWCLCCLYSSEPQNPVELKANKWIKNLLCHLFSFSDVRSNEECSFVSRLGCTPGYYYSELLNNMVSSLVAELGGNRLNGLSVQERVAADRVRNMSVLCVPLITMTDVTPLIEVLLTYHDQELNETLSVHFLEATNEALIQKKIVLSESAVLGLWLRHLPSLEKATLHLFESLVSTQIRTLEEMERVIEESLLPQAACHPSIFGVVEEMFKNALLETDGSSKVVTIIRLFTRCFLQALQKDNGQKIGLQAYFCNSHPSLVVALLQNPCDLPFTHSYQHLKCITEMLKKEVEDASCTRSLQNIFDLWFLLIHFGEWVDVAADHLLSSDSDEWNALLWLLAFYYNPHNGRHQRNQTMLEARAVADRLLILFGRTDLTARVLQDALGLNTISCQPGMNQLIRHLIISFLLFSSGGPQIAKELVAQMTQTEGAASEVAIIMAHTARRHHRTGVKHERTMELAHELLREFQSGMKNV